MRKSTVNNTGTIASFFSDDYLIKKKKKSTSTMEKNDKIIGRRMDITYSEQWRVQENVLGENIKNLTIVN